jgi:glycosyltransferase involved in cell wall biosynthesis
MLADAAVGGMSAELYGAGDLEHALRERARALSGVVVNGPIEADQVRTRLESCRILVIPSRIESVPLILGDAIQSQCRVVVSDVGDMAEIVRRLRIGTVASADDPVSLADAILSLVALPIEPDWTGAAGFLSPDRPADYFLRHLAQPANRTGKNGCPPR